MGDLLVIDQRRLEFDHAAAVGAGACDIALGANKRNAGGHQFFADRVNRRIGDLSEQLLKVIVHRLRLIGEDGEWRVVTHRAERLFAGFGTWAEDEARIFKGVAEGLLASFDVLEIVGDQCLWFRQVFRMNQVVFEPLPVRCLLGDVFFDLAIFDNAAGFHVDEEHATWLEAAFSDYVFRLDASEDSDLGCKDDLVVGGDVIA